MFDSGARAVAEGDGSILGQFGAWGVKAWSDLNETEMQENRPDQWPEELPPEFWGPKLSDVMQKVMALAYGLKFRWAPYIYR